MIGIRVFSRNPNFLAGNRMHRWGFKQHGQASSLAARCSLALRKKTVYFIFFHKKRRKQIFLHVFVFVCIRGAGPTNANMSIYDYILMLYMQYNIHQLFVKQGYWGVHWWVKLIDFCHMFHHECNHDDRDLDISQYSWCSMCPLADRQACGCAYKLTNNALHDSHNTSNSSNLFACHWV